MNEDDPRGPSDNEKQPSLSKDLIVRTTSMSSFVEDIYARVMFLVSRVFVL